MAATKRSISLPDHIAAAIEARGGAFSTTLASMIENHLAILDDARGNLSGQYSPDECALILDAVNGTAFADPVMVRLLPATVEDAIQIDDLDRKWGVDGPALMAKMDALTIPERTAIVDAAERWWQSVATGEQLEYGELLA